MSTSLAFALLALAVAAPPQAVGRPPVVQVQDGGKVRIVSAYVRTGEMAVVRGLVKRAPAWRGPVTGHLHITAFGPDSTILQRRTAHWDDRFAGSHPAAAPYQTDLAVPTAEVARIEVAFAADRHAPVEGFQ